MTHPRNDQWLIIEIRDSIYYYLVPPHNNKLIHELLCNKIFSSGQVHRLRDDISIPLWLFLLYLYLAGEWRIKGEQGRRSDAESTCFSSTSKGRFQIPEVTLCRSWIQLVFGFLLYVRVGGFLVLWFFYFLRIKPTLILGMLPLDVVQYVHLIFLLRRHAYMRSILNNNNTFIRLVKTWLKKFQVHFNYSTSKWNGKQFKVTSWS